MRYFLGCTGLASLVLFLLFVGVRVYKNIQFGLDCEDYISQAASSPDPQIAVVKLNMAIVYADRNNLTSGNTGIFFNYPTNDVGFWYQRLVISRNALKLLSSKNSQLEISNTMIRVRETLVTGNKDGTSVEEPGGIEIYPFNKLFALWGFISAILAIVCLSWWLIIFLD